MIHGKASTTSYIAVAFPRPTFKQRMKTKWSNQIWKVKEVSPLPVISSLSPVLPPTPNTLCWATSNHSLFHINQITPCLSFIIFYILSHLLGMTSLYLRFLPDKLLLIFQPPSSLTLISFPPVEAADPLPGSYSTLCEPLTALLHIIRVVCLEAAVLQSSEETTYGSFKYFI